MNFFKEYHRFVNIVIGGFDCSISDLALHLLFPSLLMIILYFFLHIQYYPEGFQNFCELCYETLYSFILGQVGYKAEECVHWLMSLMVFIIFLNVSNLFPWSYGATSQFMVNFTLAIIVFLLVITMGFRRYGLNILKHFIMDVPTFMKPFLFVLEILSFLIRPLTLAARLCINVLVGHLILHTLSAMSFGFTGSKVISLVFCVGFSIMELFVSFLQAYIFVMLSCMYIAEISSGH